MINDNAFEPQVVQIIGPMSFDLKAPRDIYTIFIDGGLNHKLDTQPVNFTSVGDGDSLRATTKSKLELTYPTDKDFSDLCGGLELLNNIESIQRVELYGFLQGRKDHELSNIFEVVNSANKHNGRIYSFENEVLILSQGQYQLDLKGCFSLFCLSPTDLKLSGNCKYQIDGSIRPHSSHGLSNIANGKVKLEVRGSHLIIYTNHKRIDA